MSALSFAVQIFAWLALALLLEALYALVGGARYLRLFRNARLQQPNDFQPPATLIVPCRGVDQDLELNLRAYFELDYSSCRILLVTGDVNDPSVPIIRRVQAHYPGIPSAILFAGHGSGRAQKVHNLLFALQHVREDDEVLVFGDSDIRPNRSWLRYLVGGLEDSSVGVTTGFRWYMPVQGNAASILRSVWNASIASLFNTAEAPFAWGGAMAVRRQTFESCEVTKYWDGTLSDDFAITHAMRDHGLPIRFEPHALSFSYGDCRFRELLDWSFRQLAITRVYMPAMWKLALISELFSNVVFWGGIGIGLLALLVWPAPSPFLAILAGLLPAAYLMRSIKGWWRIKAVGELFPTEYLRLREHAAAYVLWGPLSGLLSLWGLIRSGLSRQIEWRGIRYRMVSPRETVVLD